MDNANRKAINGKSCNVCCEIFFVLDMLSVEGISKHGPQISLTKERDNGLAAECL